VRIKRPKWVKSPFRKKPKKIIGVQGTPIKEFPSQKSAKRFMISKGAKTPKFGLVKHRLRPGVMLVRRRKKK